MGLDYSYLLYFKREALWEALQGIARIARPSPLPTLVAYPDHFRAVSLEAWGKNERIINHDDPQFGFTTAIYFPADEDIITYLKHVSHDQFESIAAEKSAGVTDWMHLHHVYTTPRLLRIGMRTPAWY
jgi:hypothetical protein